MGLARKLTVTAVLTLVSTATLVPTAAATHVGCGTVITRSTSLDSDVGPCPSTAIVIQGDNIKVDLKGHRVFGTPDPGEGPGILSRNNRGVQITNGTVSDFDAGIAIEGGGNNKVMNVTARDNIGNAATGDYGDGILIASSVDNLLLKNEAIHNGPFSGIGVYQVADSDHPNTPGGPATGNTINQNLVLDNNICRSPSGPCDNDGIRLEPGVSNNILVNNVVRGSALDGIALFRTANENVVRHNTVEDNGFHNAGHRKGDGIRVFSDRNEITNNLLFRNAGAGIAVGFVTPRGVVRPAVDNRIIANKTGGNLRFDLHDLNPDCDNNVWQANTYDTAFPPCTTAP